MSSIEIGPLDLEFFCPLDLEFLADLFDFDTDFMSD